MWLLGTGTAVALAAPAARATPIAEGGARLAATLDATHVERLWPAGTPVHWETGEPTGKGPKPGHAHTHCSAFAAAFAKHLGVYVLRPPEHSATLLANAQLDWLDAEGARNGWTSVATAEAAQALANEGKLVLAVFKAHATTQAGHVAVVRPSAKSGDELTRDGPEIAQAGAENSADTTVREGFKHHRDAWEKHRIRYFAHDVAWASVAP